RKAPASALMRLRKQPYLLSGPDNSGIMEEMDALKLSLMVGAVALSGVGVFLHYRVNRRHAERLLATRPKLDTQSFGRAYFNNSDAQAMIAAQLRELLARHVPFPLEGLAPDDAFVKDLRMDQLDSLSLVEFQLELEEHFGVKVDEKEAQRMRTFR